jgi:hypothetical protein
MEGRSQRREFVMNPIHGALTLLMETASDGLFAVWT